MAEIQTYPTGTPVAGDIIPYVEDPTGTPVLKNVDVSALLGGGGSGGGPPVTLHEFDGSTLTGCTSVTGTWTAGAEIEQTDTGSGSHDLLLASATPYCPWQMTFEAEVKFPAGGYTGISAMYNGAFQSNGPCVALHENTLYFIASGSAVLATITITAAADTWHTLKVVSTGTFWTVHLNGVFQALYIFGGQATTGNGLSLYSQSAASHYRNIKLWVG